MKSINEIFLPNSYKLYKESKITTSYNTEIPKNPFICYYGSNKWLSDFFNRKYDIQYNNVSRIGITNSFINWINNNVWTLSAPHDDVRCSIEINGTNIEEDSPTIVRIIIRGAYSPKCYMEITESDLIKYLKKHQGGEE